MAADVRTWSPKGPGWRDHDLVKDKQEKERKPVVKQESELGQEAALGPSSGFTVSYDFGQKI